MVTVVERLRRSFPDVADRIRFVTSLGNEDYLALTALGDVILDPPFFGGGNTTLEALAADIRKQHGYDVQIPTYRGKVEIL